MRSTCRSFAGKMNKYNTRKVFWNKKQIAKNYKVGIFQMIFGSVKKKFSTIIIIKWNIAPHHISNKFIAQAISFTIWHRQFNQGNDLIISSNLTFVIEGVKYFKTNWRNWVKLILHVFIPKCGNLAILLSLKFYVKSILRILEVQKLPFNTFRGSDF